ncbi:hypothetical protein BX616_007487 [Lobosporangium transversale]|uniref:Ricin B lectin domain-containing protein n=1 Tax=Lobosporangium transversale TaxID=64571 RepID=A0A1Y2GH04_9FUNG|nr:hypothetical protein BCR41DRAFT_357516 [Lobosporangium transversale]KAF9896426.1 hypothetical protein BX616_007487 [Lobosporangium transversale]ORZ10637.1 hypothetical protein BCR41DRAFT_357516 [Lobosporangium transversale]|eukprot:XP_021879358.1 hypothetical protein BCR41DRAFT_357516 [Lobosporangium transversale]
MVRSIALLGTLLALLQVALAAFLGDGLYRIKQDNDAISADETNEESPALLFPDRGYSEQVWHIKHVDDVHVTISSATTGRFLGVERARYNAFILAGWEEQQWKLTKSGEKEGHYNIVYPEQVGGEDLSIGISPYRIFPPRIALQKAHGSSSHTTHWKLEKDDGFGSCGSERKIPRFRSQLKWSWD